MDGNLDYLLGEINQRLKNIEGDVHDIKLALYGIDGQGGLTSRVSNLERRAAWVSGVISAAVSGLSWLGLDFFRK